MECTSRVVCHERFGKLERRIKSLEERLANLRSLTTGRYAEYKGSDRAIRLLKNRVESLEQSRSGFTEKTDETELKPCPFDCSGPPSIGVSSENGYFVMYCTRCGCNGPKCKTEKAARQAWNERR